MSNSHSHHRPVCRCVGFSDSEQTMKAYNPGWEEILLVRAPKMQQERWVRMSRGNWDTVAGRDHSIDFGSSSEDPRRWVDADILAAYPSNQTTVKVALRDDLSSSYLPGPVIWNPPHGNVRLNVAHAELRSNILYLEHNQVLYDRNYYYPDRKYGNLYDHTGNITWHWEGQRVLPSNSCWDLGIHVQPDARFYVFDWSER